jgi:hypothetical protein
LTASGRIRRQTKLLQDRELSASRDFAAWDRRESLAYGNGAMVALATGGVPRKRKIVRFGVLFNRAQEGFTPHGLGIGHF